MFLMHGSYINELAASSLMHRNREILGRQTKVRGSIVYSEGVGFATMPWSCEYWKSREDYVNSGRRVL